ncbi:peptide transporter family 1-like [Contarinia nasturtii]|uniref:peptide transporter family 1-like n=1 Tax=Contarinia nasturtii TaxID=265458 RepID=UPI0012D49BB0|nr:peptide transporter family 1-like [Contarinia nasturtii]
MGNSNEQTFNSNNSNKNCQNNVTTTLFNVENAEPQKHSYPKRIFLIVSMEFCERFNFHGLNTILVLYLKNKLDFTENYATMLYHTLVMMVFFTSIFGAILSDVWLGRFKTILCLSILYAIGSFIVSIGAIPGIAFSPEAALYIGLILIAFGSGGIKPCVSAFGGDQFKLPEQNTQMTSFFSMYYSMIFVGALISTPITPVLRSDVHCFGEDDCYSLAFGVPAMLMIISILLFTIGKPSYTYVKPSSENMLMKMLKCIWNAIIIKHREGKTNPRENLLDYSIEKYGTQLVHETRIILKMLTLYLPLPLFWTLSFQPGSRWTFQANQMNGDLGFYTIKPDQIQMMESLFTLIFISLCEILIYPILSKIGIRRPLQKLTIGGILMGTSFLLSAWVQFQIESMPMNSVSMLWQVPQYVLLSMAQAIFDVTGLSFSYKEAPESMKSVVLSFWLLEVAMGNVILVIISGLELFESRLYEFLFFSGIMFCGMCVFTVLAYNFEKFKKTKVLEF